MKIDHVKMSFIKQYVNQMVFMVNIPGMVYTYLDYGNLTLWWAVHKRCLAVEYPCLLQKGKNGEVHIHSCAVGPIANHSALAVEVVPMSGFFHLHETALLPPRKGAQLWFHLDPVVSPNWGIEANKADWLITFSSIDNGTGPCSRNTASKTFLSSP